MSIPIAAFLDTSILDGQQYNFQSTALSTFVPACAKRAVKLLLPEPTEQEIEHHIRERSQQAFKALEEVRFNCLLHFQSLPRLTEVAREL